MKRFYGSAVFEGEEVADSAFTWLQDIRGEEQRRIEAYKREFLMQIDELNRWRADELAAIGSHAYTLIDAQYVLIAGFQRDITRIQSDLTIPVADVEREIAQLNTAISHAHHEIAWIKSERSRLIAKVHHDYAIEYNIRLTRRDKDIAWAHSDATDKIAAVLAKRYYVPVFMLRNAKGPCEFCRAKYGTTGTLDELEKLKCIPPFHDDCRCWLEEVGYVVMSR